MVGFGFRSRTQSAERWRCGGRREKRLDGALHMTVSFWVSGGCHGRPPSASASAQSLDSNSILFANVAKRRAKAKTQARFQLTKRPRNCAHSCSTGWGGFRGRRVQLGGVSVVEWIWLYCIAWLIDELIAVLRVYPSEVYTVCFRMPVPSNQQRSAPAEPYIQ